jgi:hypothetical protein
VPGYPIRTPSDHSSVDNSPRTIAASHVLHRPLMPRHPPCALNNFTTTPHTHSAGRCHEQNSATANQDARIHYPTLNTPPHPHPPPTPPHPHRQPPTATNHTDALDAPDREQHHQEHTHPHPREPQVSSQDPTACRTHNAHGPDPPDRCSTRRPPGRPASRDQIMITPRTPQRDPTRVRAPHGAP